MSDQAQPLRDLVADLRPCMVCREPVHFRDHRLTLCLDCQNNLYWYAARKHDGKLDKTHEDVQ